MWKICQYPHLKTKVMTLDNMPLTLQLTPTKLARLLPYT
jgi:hypothetical protein